MCYNGHITTRSIEMDAELEELIALCEEHELYENQESEWDYA
jgi:hypothetical protein